MFFKKIKKSCLLQRSQTALFICYKLYHHAASFADLLQLFTDAQKRLRIVIA